MPGDTAGSQGEAAVHLTSSAMSLRRPTPSSPAPGPPESWFETRLGQLGSAGPPRGWRESVGPGWCRLPLRPCLLFADFNENGFIDEEDLQRIILRLLNSNDMSEDLLTDLTSRVCARGCGVGLPLEGWQDKVP